MIFLATEFPAWFYPVVVPLSILFVYLFVIPLLIAQTIKLSGKPEIIEFVPEQTPPPKSVRSYFSDSDLELTDLGFERLKACLMPEAVTNVCTVLTIYVHKKNLDMAMVTAMWGIVESADALQALYIEFQSEFSEGNTAVIETANIIEVDPFRVPEDHLKFRFPSLAETSSIAQIYQYHQTLVEHHAAGKKKTLLLTENYDDDVPAYIKKEVLMKAYNRQVEFGILKFNERTSNFTPTFLGSFKMIWKLLPPFKQFIQFQNRQTEKRLVKQIENQFF